MRLKGIGLLAIALCGLLLSGCAVGLDALNPGFFAGLGFDPNTIIPPAGTIIVAFKNNTNAPATFLAYESASAADLTLDSRNFMRDVEPGKSRNEVLDCPVALISPGSLDAGFAPDAVAAVVVTGGGAATDVSYGGVELLEGREFVCGDVILIELHSVAVGGQGGQAAAYLITVRVIPGH